MGTVSGFVSGRGSQVLDRAGAFDHFARIENPRRIKCRFDVLKRLINPRAEQPRIQIAARQTVAMLAAHRAVELKHKLADFVGDFFEPREVRAVGRVDQRADVQAAH